MGEPRLLTVEEAAAALTCANDAVRILVGDCRETLAALPAGSVDCVVTSPPYYGLRDYGCDGQIGLEQTPAEYVAQLVAVFRECRRVLKPGATMWVNLGDSYAASGTKSTGRNDQGGASISSRLGRTRKARIIGAKVALNYGAKPKDLLGIPWRVAFALQDDGWWLRSEIIWHKPNPMPESVTDRPTKAHEQVFMFSNTQKYWYDKKAIEEHATRGAANSRFDAGKTAFHQLGRASTRERNEDSNRNARTVWTIAAEPCDLAHFALMPTELARRCILAGCPKGGVVLDPFGGGGTTGLTAARHGRRAILCELNPEYAEIARQRIAREWREPVKPADAPDLGPLFASAAE